MEPNSLGRKLGVGLRVAGKIAHARASEAARPTQAAHVGESPAAVAPAQDTPEAQQRALVEAGQRGRSAGSRVRSGVGSGVRSSTGHSLGRGLGKGTKNFADSFFSPLAHAGGVLWLEITGCFFALFALFFAQNVYELRAQYAAGALHRKFELYCLLTVLFVYFSASSFVKARRKARRQRARG